MKTNSVESARAIDANASIRYLDRLFFPAIAVAVLASLVLALITG